MAKTALDTIRDAPDANERISLIRSFDDTEDEKTRNEEI
jgi:hypothetical protein